MKRGQIIEAFRLISGIKMNVVSDKETRKAIISNHLQMYKLAESHDNEVKEVYKKLFEGKEEEMSKVNELRQEFNSSDATQERKIAIIKELTTDYKNILELEGEFNVTIENLINEDVDVDLVPFNKEEFVDACANSNLEFTMNDIVRLEGIFAKEDEAEEVEE